MARHNKKRNVGLIYEQLIMCISRALVSDENEKVVTAKRIIEKRFAKNTQLYKEFRLFNALICTSGVSQSLATRILGEAQKAAQDHDGPRLDREKSLLIKEINHLINETGFYDQRVGNYVHYATIQTLLNNWRSSTPDIRQTVKHEVKIQEWLCRAEEKVTLAEHKSPEVNDLTVSIMEKKFQQKYGKTLNKRQQLLIHLYLSENFVKLDRELVVVTAETRNVLRKYGKVGKNKFLLEKTEKVHEHIQKNSDGEPIDRVLRGMVLCQLLNELNGEING